MNLDTHALFQSAERSASGALELHRLEGLRAAISGHLAKKYLTESISQLFTSNGPLLADVKHFTTATISLIMMVNLLLIIFRIASPNHLEAFCKYYLF